ncbi:uncharacterized protein PG998_009906 [Apiospora kogelbergensis]|uniref:SGNH hydrolase-type esterase domain-containing protein n=1 Tax=Apiospora kogelbergensis TaxID=1337665 RepID=A0AAW0R900_9PEZI
MSPLRIASLGSSFAAGPGIPPVIDTKAARSGANYAHLLYARLGGAILTDLTVSGATLRNILDEPQVEDGGRTVFAPQIEGLPTDTEVVLILGGGNDAKYIGGVFMDSFDAYWLFRIATRVYRWFYPLAPEPSERELDMEALAALYGEVLDAVHARAPNARVLVVEYLTVLGDDVRPGFVDVPFDGRLLARHRGTAEKLQMATVKAVQGREEWCVRVPVAEPSAAHGIGAERPWVSGWGWRLLLAKGAYHPNAEGMVAVAEMIYQKMLGLGMTAGDRAATMDD